MERNILLIEPNYKNKYPPLGLMKLATYHRKLGDNVSFYKGDLKQFLLNELYKEIKVKLENIDSQIEWYKLKNEIIEYMKTGKTAILDELTKCSNYNTTIKNWLIYYKKIYRKKETEKYPKWDRICITTLFTFHWKITIETIEFAKNIVKNLKEIWVGGVMASVIPEEIKKETGIKPWKGLLDKPCILDKDNKYIIDELPLDYSILDEIDYKYPESNAYYSYMTRGCKRDCPFCAVSIIEPVFKNYIPLLDKVDYTKRIYGEQRNLLLLDNNVLFSTKFPQIINEIKKCGFQNGETFVEPNYLEISINNLKRGLNDRAYIKKTFNLIQGFLSKLKGDTQHKLYNLLVEYSLLYIGTATKENILKIYPLISELYEQHRNKRAKVRYVDFNQGIDVRLLTEEKMKLLSEIPIRPLRISFDNIKYKDIYIKAVNLAVKYGITNLSNYLLYNEKDKPIELYQRLKINVKLCEKLNIYIYSFPMKFHPFNGTEHLNRNYLGKYWNRKFIRAIQTILNATKGKVGRGKSFFYKAFGKDKTEYLKLLYMPETFILYRRFFEEIGLTDKWWNEFMNLSRTEEKEIKEIIHRNDFKNIYKLSSNQVILGVLEYYTITREDLKNKSSTIYELKKNYYERGKMVGAGVVNVLYDNERRFKK